MTAALLRCFCTNGDRGNDGLFFLSNQAVGVNGYCCFADRIHNIHSLCYITKGSILAVQKFAVFMDNEELGAGAVIIVGASHGNGTTGMGQGIVIAVVGELTYDGFIRSARSVAVGVATLHHEALNDSVEGQTVIEAAMDATEETTEGTESTDAAAGTLDESLTYYADIVIADYGTITVQLDQASAPITVANFVELAESGFYDGLTFHRIIEGFMMQGGDPEGDGTGGSDETIVGEFSDNGYDNTLTHTRGAISMARSNDYP